MADNVELPNVTALTLEDINQYLQEKRTNHNCPKCGCQDWSLGDADQKTAVIPLTRTNITSLLQVPFFLPTIWLMCVKCAHLEFVAAMPIARWKDEKKQ